MILFFAATLIYVGLLLLIKPAPSSLKSQPITFVENFKIIWSSMLMGVLILVVYLLISQFKFVSVNEKIYGIFSLNNNLKMAALWPLQSVTHLFIHANLLHLISNLAGLGLASVYERRVGARRYFSVLLVGCMASIPSILFYSEMTTVCGISGGVFGLAAAYFTDMRDLTAKEWITAILYFIFIAAIISINGELKSDSKANLHVQVNHIGHAMGAIGAVVYCRLKPRNEGMGSDTTIDI